MLFLFGLMKLEKTSEAPEPSGWLWPIPILQLCYHVYLCLIHWINILSSYYVLNPVLSTKMKAVVKTTDKQIGKYNVLPLLSAVIQLYRRSSGNQVNSAMKHDAWAKVKKRKERSGTGGSGSEVTPSKV